MMRPLALAMLLGAAGAAPALAVQDAAAGRYDSRVRTVAYNPMQVVRVHGAPLTSTQIAFAPTETITHVAIGDGEAWLAQPAGNLLFVKPTETRSTNMQVVTRRADGNARSYQFELVARAAGSTQLASNGATVPLPGSSEPAEFAINFAYPSDAREAAAAERRQRLALAAERRAEARLEADFFSGPRNWRYTAQGSRSIEPAEVSDNGRLTAFRFPGNMTVPTIYAVAADGQETIVPHTMRADLVILSTTAREFRLRFGGEVLRVFNLSYDPVGINPGTGTTTPDVVRSVRETRR